MGLKPYDRTVSQIFNNVKYDIDFYQREYKWNDNLTTNPYPRYSRTSFIASTLSPTTPIRR